MYVYVLTLTDFGNEYNETDIHGVFKEKSDAIRQAKKLLEDNLSEYTIMDNELNIDNIDKNNLVVVFFDHLGNWDDYFEIKITQSEVK